MDSTLNGRSRTRVLLLSDASVLDLAVEGLLRQDAVLEIVDPESDLDDTLYRIRTFEPDVIIVNEARRRRDSALMRQRILGDMPGSRLIVLNAQEESISIYEAGRQAVKMEADLLDAVQLAELELPVAR
jgi:DNA-binding NarL/FixJ family response regulator